MIHLPSEGMTRTEKDCDWVSRSEIKETLDWRDWGHGPN